MLILCNKDHHNSIMKYWLIFTTKMMMMKIKKMKILETNKRKKNNLQIFLSLKLKRRKLIIAINIQEY